jgi:hypothetical protein
MKVSFAHICDYATVSQEGKPSIMGIFSFIASHTFPVVHAQLYVVFEIDLSSAELNQQVLARLQLQGADGNEVWRAESQFRVGGQAKPGERPKVTQLVPITNLPIPAPGMYQFSIWLNGAHQRDVPFEVRKLNPPTPRTP